MSTIFLIESYDYEGTEIHGAYDNKGAAEHHTAILNEEHGCPGNYGVREIEVRSLSTHKVLRWFLGTASWDVLSGYHYGVCHRSAVIEAPYELAMPDFSDPSVERFRSQHDNPGYVRDTPNARIPDTPGGRYITTPAWAVVVADPDEESAQARAKALLEAALDADGITR